MYDTSASAQAFAEALGAEIAYWRKRRGMSRPELAELAGISATTVGRIEREGPKDVSDTWRLAKVLNVPLQTMVERAEQAAQMSLLDFGEEERDAAIRRGISARRRAPRGPQVRGRGGR